MSEQLSRRAAVKKIAMFTGGSLAATMLPNWLQAAINFDPVDEEQRRRTAKYIMQFASPYANDNWRVSPHMHQEIKKNIQQISQGKVFVEIIDDGKGGVGTDLMADVSHNRKAAALISVSNLTPGAKELDILNIPFWLENEQSYVNLVTSPTFERLVLSKIKAQGLLEPLFFYLPGFRTATSTKSFAKTIRVPGDMEGQYVRVPPSKMLKQFYTLAGAKTRKVPWKNVYKAAQQNKIQVMDPSVVGLYGGPNGLKDHLSVISKINSVYDGWVAVASQQWMKNLDPVTREQVKEAIDKTFREQLVRVKDIDQLCEQEFKKIGVSIYNPTVDEKQQWHERCGHDRPEWDSYKKAILGNPSVFDELLESSQVKSRFIL